MAIAWNPVLCLSAGMLNHASFDAQNYRKMRSCVYNVSLFPRMKPFALGFAVSHRKFLGESTPLSNHFSTNLRGKAIWP